MMAPDEMSLGKGTLCSARQRILVAARQVAGQQGLGSFSMERVATESGVSRRTIYNQFPDRESLYRAVMLELVEAAENFLAPSLAKGLPLAAGARALCAQARAVLGCDAYRQIRRAIDRDGASAPWLAPLVERRLLFPLRFSLQAYLVHLAADGTLRILDVESLCDCLLRIIELHSKENDTVLSVDELAGIMIGRLAPHLGAAP